MKHSQAYYQRRWRARHPDKVAAINAKRRGHRETKAARRIRYLKEVAKRHAEFVAMRERVAKIERAVTLRSTAL